MASRDKKPAKPSSSRAGGIRTLSDLNRRSGPDSDSDSDSPQEYYTGGEKRSSLSFPFLRNLIDAFVIFLKSKIMITQLVNWMLKKIKGLGIRNLLLSY